MIMKMLTGKRRHCHNEANECTYRFENVKGLRVDLISGFIMMV